MSWILKCLLNSHISNLLGQRIVAGFNYNLLNCLASMGQLCD